jgi:hypothetical protein
MSKGKTAGAFFLFALFARLFIIFIFPPGGTDLEMLHTAVNNLLSGNGLTYTLANPNDISQVYYKPMTEWPPLTAYILSVLKAVTGSAKVADLLMMCFGMTFLLLVMRGIMTCMKLSDAARSILWIIVATNSDAFARVGITDLYGGLFFLWGVLFCLRFLETEQQSPGRLAVAALFFFLPAAFRYQYYPLVFIFPSFLLFAGHYSKRKQLVRSGILSLSIVFFFVALQAALLVQTTGKAAFLAEDATGFFPENLLLNFPAVLKSIFCFSYIENTLLAKAGVWPTLVSHFVILLFTLSLIFFGTYSFFKYFGSKQTKRSEFGSETQLQLSRFLLFVSCTFISGLLMVLSLRYREQSNYYGKFTYVAEGRYYFAAMMMMPILFASYMHQISFPFSGFTFRLKRVAIASLVLFNLSLFGKFLFNAASHSLKRPGKEWVAEKQNILHEIERSKAEYPFPVVTAETIKYFAYQPSLGHYSILKDIRLFTGSEIKSSQPVQLIFFTTTKPTKEQSAFIRQNRAKIIYSGTKCRVYRIVTVPHHSLASL